MCFPSMEIEKGWKFINIDSVYFSAPANEGKKKFEIKSEDEEEKKPKMGESRNFLEKIKENE